MLHTQLLCRALQFESVLAVKTGDRAFKQKPLRWALSAILRMPGIRAHLKVIEPSHGQREEKIPLNTLSGFRGSSRIKSRILSSFPTLWVTKLHQQKNQQRKHSSTHYWLLFALCLEKHSSAISVPLSSQPFRKILEVER